MRSAVLWACGLTALALPPIVRAGPPFVTDDPEPVEPHHWEINSAVTGSWHGNQASVGVPTLDINYGAIPDVQLHAQPRHSIEHGNGATARGVDDTEIGVKYRFFDRHNDSSAVMLGIYPMYQLATGARRLGPDRGSHGILLPLWAQYEKGDWTLYGGSGYRIGRGADARNSLFNGATLLRQVRPGVQLGIEVFHETATTTVGGSTRGFNFGGTLKLAPGLNLLLSAGRSFAQTPSNLLYIGLQNHF
jgi:hypothetical protein